MSQETKDNLKAMDFFLSLKVFVKVSVVNMDKSFLINYKSILLRLLKYASKAVLKTAKSTGDLIGNKWANKTKSKSEEIPKEREIKERSIKIPNKSYIALQKDTTSY